MGKIEIDGLMPRIIIRVFMRIIHIISALSIIVGIYSIANRPKLVSMLNKHKSLITLSGYCYGVYVFHQFILMTIYYKIPTVDIIDPLILPWIGFAVTLILSLLFTHYTLRTRFGRFLIG